MDHTTLYNTISIRICKDEQFLSIIADINRLEPEYLRIMAGLSEKDQELLSLYIAACEDAQSYRIYPAYQIGKSHRWLQR